MVRLRQLWTELNRERSFGRRSGRGGRSSRSGVALLLVITTVAMMTVLVTEIVHGAAVRLQLAASQRDEAKAEALALSGIQFYRLLLIANKQLGNSALMGLSAQLNVPINADTLWQLIPTVNSNVMRMLLLADGDEEGAREMQDRGGMTQEELEASREIDTSLKKPFLDFDGDFSATVHDEDRRIYVGRLAGTNMVELMSSPHAGMLASLMSGEQQENFLTESNIDKWELIANLADWTDQDSNRLFDGGNEDTVYQNIEEDEAPYLPKNAPFDTLEEIRLVDGWERDAVWLRYGRHLTIYGNGQINVNTADRRVMEAIFQRFINPPPNADGVNFLWQQIQNFRNTSVFSEGGGGIFKDPGQFLSFIKEFAPGTVDSSIQGVLTTRSTTFRVTSRGEVGNANVAIDAVFDFQRSDIGKVMYWHVQ